MQKKNYKNQNPKKNKNLSLKIKWLRNGYNYEDDVECKNQFVMFTLVAVVSLPSGCTSVCACTINKITRCFVQTISANMDTVLSKLTTYTLCNMISARFL